MPDLDPAWSGRLRATFGAPLGEVGYEHIEALVPAQVSEAADLDFKEALYGNSAGDKHELCKDIAAMRNHRGGVIVLGSAMTTASRSPSQESPSLMTRRGECARSSPPALLRMLNSRLGP